MEFLREETPAEWMFWRQAVGVQKMKEVSS